MNHQRSFYYSISPWIALALGASVLVGSVTCLILAKRAKNKGVAFASSYIRVAEDPVEYSLVTVPCTLVNYRNQSVELESIEKSCSCTSVTSASRAELVFPIHIAAGEELTFYTTIDPIGRFGLQRQSLICKMRDGDQKLHCQAIVEMSVIPGWRLVPGAIALENVSKGEDLHRSAYICDGLNDPELTVADFSNSHPQAIDLKIIDLSKERDVGPITSDVPGLTPRFRLDLTVHTPSTAGERLDARITIRPGSNRFDAARVPPLVLPVTSSTMPEGCVFVPRMLLISKGAKQSPMTREFKCQSFDAEVSGIEVVDAPKFLTIRFRDSAERAVKLMTIHIDMDGVRETDVLNYEITLRGIRPSEPAPLYRFPIRIY